MRTKTLLLAAAALAAGLAASLAQSNVYSVNIAGYINVPLAAGKNVLLENPLNNGTNDLTSIDNGALPNKSIVQVWNGSKYWATTKTGGSWPSNFSIAPGAGFFVSPYSASTLTFVGTAPSSNNYALAAGKNVMIGAIIPIAGTLTDAGPNSLNLGGAFPNKSIIQVWNGSKYWATTKTGGSWPSNFNIGTAQGFFVSPYSASTWTQSLQ